MVPTKPRCLALHTGGSCWVDATASVGPRVGPLVRWLGTGWGLELGSGLVPALEEIGVGTLPDGRSVSAWWLRVTGERPTGTSADLVLAVAILLVARLGPEGHPGEGSQALVTGSGSLELDPQGRPRVVEVQGWPAKIAALATHLAASPCAHVLLLHPAAQAEEVQAALDAHGLEVQAVGLDDAGALPQALADLLPDEAWRPAGWPALPPELARLLRQARRHAQQTSPSYVGVEHLTLALLESGARGETLDRLRYLLAPAQLRPTVQGVALIGAPGEPTPTPRLCRLAAALPPAPGAEDLARALVSDPATPLHGLAGGDLALRLPAVVPELSFETAHAQGAPIGGFAGVLEVQGGPEDGRLLRMSAGQALGRWAPEGAPEHALYQDTPLKDRFLSRAHLVYLGEGRLRLRQSARLIGLGQDRALEPGQELRIEAGQVLRLTPLTWLYAHGEADLA